MWTFWLLSLVLNCIIELKTLKNPKIDSNYPGLPYNIDIEDIANMEKSELKKKVKEGIKEEMKKMIDKASSMTKMRFIKTGEFQRQDYITEFDSIESLRTLKTRLNMLPVYGNFKGDLTMERKCPYCKKADDTTEHLIECTELGSTNLKAEDMEITNNAQIWRTINERIQFNLNHREKAKKWKRTKQNWVWATW